MNVVGYLLENCETNSEAMSTLTSKASPQRSDLQAHARNLMLLHCASGGFTLDCPQSNPCN